MPAQTGKSVLLAKLGNRVQAAHEKHKADPAQLGNPGLPGGIDNGVAQLVDIKLGEFKEGDNKGQLFFMASGIVKLPEEVGGVSVKGLRTQIGPEPLCDTPKSTGDRARKTFDDHYAWMLNQIRILGIDTAKLAPDQIEAAMAALKQRRPHFRFRTWKPGKQDIGQHTDGKWYLFNLGEKGNRKGIARGPYPNEETAKKLNPYAGRDPRVFQEWNGHCPAPSENGQGPMAAVEESTGPVPDTEAAVMVEEGTAEVSVETTTEETAQGSGESFSEFEDIDSLIGLAGGDEDDPEDGASVLSAREKLMDMGKAAGLEEDTILNAESWDAVKDLILAAQQNQAESSGAEEPTPEPEPEPTPPPPPAKPAPKVAGPVVGKTAKYRLVDPKTKKPLIDGKTKKVRRPVDCEIVAVDAKTKTVTLKNLDDGKTLYKGVKWGDLNPAG